MFRVPDTPPRSPGVPTDSETGAGRGCGGRRQWRYDTVSYIQDTISTRYRYFCAVTNSSSFADKSFIPEEVPTSSVSSRPLCATQQTVVLP